MDIFLGDAPWGLSHMTGQSAQYRTIEPTGSGLVIRNFKTPLNFPPEISPGSVRLQMDALAI